MTLKLTTPFMTHTDFAPRISVIGVGGGGANAVDNMIAANLQGVEFVVANTDAQQLMHSRCDRRVQLGAYITQGLGAGAKPEIGRAAAEEVADELYRHLDGAHMVFITAGMGGGTGTGAAPVIARMARERNILTVGVVTKPFGFEGVRRARSADQGIEELQQYVDTLIVIPNQNLFRMANERTTWRDAFKMADQVLYMGVRGVTDLMMVHGLVNLDFADIRTVMAEMGKAMMGTGEAEGENRAIRAAEAAINNPLLEDTSMSGARGLLINITGGEDLTLFEVDQAANRVREEVDEEANVIFGSAVDPLLLGRIRVSVVATGIDPHQPTEQARPKLVSVNGGATLSPKPFVVRNSDSVVAASMFMPSVASPLRQILPQPEVLIHPMPAMEVQAPQSMPQQKQPVQQAHSAPAAQSLAEAVLFAGSHGRGSPSHTAKEKAEPARPSLFNAMTGAFRRRVLKPTTPVDQSESMQLESPIMGDPDRIHHAAGRVTSVSSGIDIEVPTFLRRQRSSVLLAPLPNSEHDIQAYVDNGIDYAPVRVSSKRAAEVFFGSGIVENIEGNTSEYGNKKGKDILSSIFPHINPVTVVDEWDASEAESISSLRAIDIFMGRPKSSKTM